jgi:XTP/dITP diphosphohydrolase
MTTLLLATGNPGKVREFETALAPLGVTIVGLDSLDDRTEVEETGETFEANARLKAEGYSLRTDLLTLAEDSGIEVDALHGAPGVHSARYGGEGLDDQGRLNRMLRELEGVQKEHRSARYRAVIAIARAGQTIATFTGTAEGRILEAPRGSGGFGYDPIFFHEASGRTFAEMTREEKQPLSHRGDAVRKLIQAFPELE